MCLISVLPKGTKKNTEEVYNFIKSGQSCNKQGSGFMYKRDGSNIINVIKGFFDCDNLIDTIKKLDFKDDDELVIHHRISTSGQVNNYNCHPFVISNDHEEVIMTSGKTRKPCLVHNGVFKNMSAYRSYTDPFSDTYTFTRYIISNKNVMNIFKTDKIFFKNVFAEILGNSKLAIIYPDRPLEMFGDFTEKNGYFHSNDGYCRHVHNVGGYSKYSKVWDGYGMNDGYYDAMWDEQQRQIEIQDEINARNREFLKDNASKIADTGDKIISNESNLKGNKFKTFKLDNSFIKITPKNCYHFNYVLKDIWDREAYVENMRIYEMNEDFDSSALCTSMKRVEKTIDSIKYVYNGILTEKLLNDCYYIPKNKDLERVYSDLLKLVTCKQEISKKSIKKLHKLLWNYTDKFNMDEIMYHRIGKRVTKMSLALYKEYVDQNFEKVEKEVKVLN